MPRQANKMASHLSSILQRSRAFLTPSASSDSLPHFDTGNQKFAKAAEGALFPKVDPIVDGDDCDHDCESCDIKYPAKWKIDEHQNMYGHVNGWATHLLVATGKTDWVRDVEDEKGSVMEAIGKYGKSPKNGKLMLSASNIPLPENEYSHEPASNSLATTVLLLPAFTLIHNVTPASVPDLIASQIDQAPTTTTPLTPPTHSHTQGFDAPLPSQTPPPDAEHPVASSTHIFATRPCPHDYLILLCSQRTRDARCGQSAPLLRREFERHLRPLGLYRDLHDERPGGVGIYFISHTGGHKFAANVMIYRRHAIRGKPGAGKPIESENGQKSGDVAGVDVGGGIGEKENSGEAGQCIWLARVRPEDCEGIVKFTVLQGKVVKPERQLRGGFDRERGLISW